MLQDQNTYRQLSKDPTTIYKEQSKSLVEYRGYRANILTKKEKRYLIPSVCRIPVIYTLSKIHKDDQAPLGRPIVNRIGLITARLGEYLDKFLQASVIHTNANLKTTKDFLQRIEGVHIPDNRDFF